MNGIQKEMREGFAGLRQEMDERFGKIDERFERIEQRISKIFPFLGVGFTILAALITLFQFVD